MKYHPSPTPPTITCKNTVFTCTCRERISSSLTLYELGRRFWQHQDYERSLVAVEQAVALKLFPYKDGTQLERWQRGLLTPGYLFKRPKLELADALILKANCMYELGRRSRSIERLYQALEAVHLAAAFMHCSKVRECVDNAGYTMGMGSIGERLAAAACCTKQDVHATMFRLKRTSRDQAIQQGTCPAVCMECIVRTNENVSLHNV